jgi:predicted HAD superfamily phosphohydrolase YqeG
MGKLIQTESTVQKPIGKPMSINVNVMDEEDIANFLKTLRQGEKFTVMNEGTKNRILDAAKKTNVRLNCEAKPFKHEFERL